LTEEFDAAKWLEEITADHEDVIERVEAEADNAAEAEAQQKGLAALARQVDGLTKEQRKESVGRKLSDYRASFKEDDPRANFMWVLEGADSPEKLDKAIATIDSLGAKASAVSSQGDEDDAGNAFQPPVDSSQSVKVDRTKQLWETVHTKTGHERSAAENEIWLGDTQLAQNYFNRGRR
jgi:hypothetical protein